MIGSSEWCMRYIKPEVALLCQQYRYFSRYFHLRDLPVACHLNTDACDTQKSVANLAVLHNASYFCRWLMIFTSMRVVSTCLMMSVRLGLWTMRWWVLAAEAARPFSKLFTSYLCAWCRASSYHHETCCSFHPHNFQPWDKVMVESCSRNSQPLFTFDLLKSAFRLYPLWNTRGFLLSCTWIVITRLDEFASVLWLHTMHAKLPSPCTLHTGQMSINSQAHCDGHSWRKRSFFALYQPLVRYT